VTAERILMTGGDGRLGTELLPLLDNAVAPSEAEMDITDPAALEATFRKHRPTVVLHAAAYTDVSAAQRERARCWQVNVCGTRNVVRAAARAGAKLVHISTDYVFEGTAGGYREDDPPGPVRNYYALSKLAAEELARFCPEHLILRTSFRARQWPHPVAYRDVYTSQDYVDVIAPMIAAAVRRCREIPHDVLHVVTERKSAFELARRRRPDVQPGSKADADVDLPEDISLDASRYQALARTWSDE